MILLLGDEYGSVAPGHSKSFTHLEYEEAVRDEAGVRVLVFCVGEHYRDRRIRFAAAGTSLGGWQREVDRRHTVGFFEPDASVEQIAQSILEALVIALFELRFGQLHIEDADQHRDLFDAISDEGVLDDSDVTALESREFELRGLSMIDDRAEFSETRDVLMRPAAVAAYEQREEAQRAISLADYGCAIRHLQRAIELRPLDLLSNYWLASLYVALGRKQDCVRARELSERAARMALDQGSRVRASACYLLAARAARLLEQHDEAVLYARQATEVAPRYAKARIELARCLVIRREGDAMKEVRIAGDLYFPSLREIFADPQLRSLRGATNAMIEKMRLEMVGNANRILIVEGRLAALAGSAASTLLDEGASRHVAFAAARQSASKQYNWVCRLVRDAQSALQKLSSIQGAAAQALNSEIMQLEELGRADSSLLAQQESVNTNLSGLNARARTYWSCIAGVAALGAAVDWWLDGRRAGAVLAALVGMYLLRTGYRAIGERRQRMQIVQAKIREIQGRMQGYAAKTASARAGLGLLEIEARSAVTCARDALELFESGSLRQPIGLLPFASLFSGKAGDVVRVWRKQLDAFGEKSGRTTVIEDGLPDWLEKTQPPDDTKPRLYRVTRSEGSRLILSRATAYRG